jgi:hypothetical protein
MAQGVWVMRLIEEVSRDEVGKMRKLQYSKWRRGRCLVSMSAYHRGDRERRMFDDEARWGTEVGVQMRREAA